MYQISHESLKMHVLRRESPLFLPAEHTFTTFPMHNYYYEKIVKCTYNLMRTLALTADTDNCGYVSRFNNRLL